MRVSISVFVVVLIVLVSPACAGTDPALNSCLSLPAQGQRIDCFDEIITKRKGQDYVTEIMNSANWNIGIYRSPINDLPIVTVYVYANEEVWYEGYGRISPLLMIACYEGDMRFYVDFEKKLIDDRFYVSTGKVIYRIDSNNSVEENWSVSSTYSALGLWGSQKSIPFIKSLIGKKQFVFRVFPIGQSVYTVTFEIKNLDVAIEYVRLACDW